MNGFMNRIALLRARLGPDMPPVVLVYANGERRSMGTLEAVHEVTSRTDIVGAECSNETAASLFRAIIEAEGEDFGDVVETEIYH